MKMNTFLPKNQWMNFNCFKEKDFCIVNNLDRRLKDRLFYCFTQCFDLQKDFAAYAPTPRLSMWKDIIFDALSERQKKFLVKKWKYLHRTIPKALAEILYDITDKGECNLTLADHSRMFLDVNGGPILISAVYRHKDSIESFISSIDLGNLITAVMPLVSWRAPKSEGTCLIVFNTNDYLKDKAQKFFSEAQGILGKN